MWKKLFLVGFAAVILPGTLMQLMIGLMFTLVFTLIAGVASPYRNHGDDYFSLATNFALSCVFVFLVVLKMGVLTEAVQSVMNGNLRSLFHFNSASITIGLVLGILFTLVLVLVVASVELYMVASIPTIRLQKSGSRPLLTLSTRIRWHQFNSHIWSSGQECACAAHPVALDACATQLTNSYTPLPSPRVPPPLLAGPRIPQPMRDDQAAALPAPPRRLHLPRRRRPRIDR